ncbi:uncharacterized protein J8A68_006115 [[Candida] subhashii]|uniref:Uncharacterized protein n=1 Tax=[Candida] subhashii TaxID=561895 RepID=A0A8J5QCQ3_9ASCO|nr:uncharacterized protein J8A68_006115 [[Candida] subhashii]KAG7660373.1 hypothetical protein J8A68_006115 [[Candida] subhashii]
MDYDYLRYFQGAKVRNASKPIVARTASNIFHKIKHETEIKLPKPFDCTLRVYLMKNLKQLLIGEPTLRKWNYEMRENRDKVCISKRCFYIVPRKIYKIPKKSDVLSITLEKDFTDFKQQLLKKYPMLFSTEPRPPKERTYKYHIITKDEIPVLQVPYFQTPEEKQVIKAFIDEKKKAGVLVDEIPGSWLSPVFAIKQKTKYRVVVDLRKVNDKTVVQPVYLPNFKDLSNELKTSKYFSVFDLKSAYHQIAVDEETSRKFGIITPFGNFNFTTLPFGAVNSPFVFSKFLNEILPKEHVFAYMDDILIHTPTLHLHKRMIDKVCKILNDNGLQMNLEKTQFIQRRVKFLGYYIHNNGLSPTIDKMKAINNWQLPTTTTEVRSVVNFTNFFRQFIPQMSEITGPLTDLIRNNPKKRHPIQHTKKSIEAFKKLKECLVNLPTLAIYNVNQPTYIFSDSSDAAIGGILCQIHRIGNKNCYLPISFASFKLNDTQKRYSAMEKELLAIITILKKFNYLCNGNVIVFTDHQSLSILQSKTTVPPMRIARFLDVLGAYSPTIKYLPGKNNYVADILSRYQTNNIDNAAEEKVNQIDAIEIQDLNDDDLEHIQSNLSDLSNDNVALDEYPYDKFRFEDGKLKVILKDRLVNVADRTEFTNHVAQIHKVHHPSIRVTDYLATMSLWHPDHKLITTDIVNHCEYCQVHSNFSKVQRELFILEPLHAFERWGLDYVILNEQNGVRYILVAVEYVTGLLYASATSTMEATTVHWMINWIYQLYGTPKEIVTDNGTSFVNSTIATLCQQLNIYLRIITQ